MLKNAKISLTLALTALALCTKSFAENYTANPIIDKLFVEHNITGTLVIADERRKDYWVYDSARAKQRFSPASTFKLPHTLFALDAGILKDEFQFITWDGINREVPAWNQHQNLRSAMRDSVVWVYQDFAKKLGPAKETRYLNRLGYGNQNANGDIAQFWLNGTLTISAFEQIDFLRKLYKNALPFNEAHQRLLKDVMINEAGKDWILRAKTGWSTQPPSQIGWWVGWVEWPQGPVFFAMNMDMLNKEQDLPKRQSIVREVLMNLQALPANTSADTSATSAVNMPTISTAINSSSTPASGINDSVPSK